MSARIAVLASGGGTNLQAILDYFDSRGVRALGRVVVVASDRAQSGALDRARRAEIEALPLAREQRGDALAELLTARRIDFIALAGYLRLVPPAVARTWHGRMVNVHPALLPAFGGHGMYGHHVHDAVLRAGARISGPTVHFVDHEFDKGPIIAQWPVPVAFDDTSDSLATRVLRAEHALYPRVLRGIIEGRIALGDDGRVRGALDAARDTATFLPARNGDSLTDTIDALLFG